jgi:hypothetical protein
MVEICFEDFIHCDDIAGFLKAVDELKLRKTANAPVKTTARLRFGGNVARETYSPVKDYQHQDSERETFVYTEILLYWGCGASITVGLAVLDSHQPTPMQPVAILQHNASYAWAKASLPHEHVLNGSDQVSSAETGARSFILNGSDQVSFAETDAHTFISMEARDHKGGLMVKPYSDRKCEEFRVLAGRALQVVVDTPDDGNAGVLVSL